MTSASFLSLATAKVILDGTAISLHFVLLCLTCSLAVVPRLPRLFLFLLRMHGILSL